MNRDKIEDTANGWHMTAEAYANYGAYDTEPRNVFARRVVDFAEDPSQEIPELEAEEWSLYTSSRDCEEAAGELNMMLEFVCMAIRDAGGLCGLTYDDFVYER